MNEPKFTKGPWYAYSHDFKDCLDEYYTEWGVSSSKTKRSICTMLGVDSEDEINANASLIAAAPEMYDLLLDIVTDYQCMPNPAVMANKIETVLKKARGEE